MRQVQQWIGICDACEEIPWENWQERKRHRILAEADLDSDGWPTNLRFIASGANDCATCAEVCQEIRDSFKNNPQDIADFHALCSALNHAVVDFERETQEIHRLAGM
jgi:hypothetical protein